MFSIKEGIHEIEVSGRKLLLQFGAPLPEPDTVAKSTIGTWTDPVTMEDVSHSDVHSADDTSKTHLRVTDVETSEAVHIVFAKNGGKLSEHAVKPLVEALPETTTPETTTPETTTPETTTPETTTAPFVKEDWEKGTNIPARHEVESQA